MCGYGGEQWAERGEMCFKSTDIQLKLVRTSPCPAAVYKAQTEYQLHIGNPAFSIHCSSAVQQCSSLSFIQVVLILKQLPRIALSIQPYLCLLQAPEARQACDFGIDEAEETSSLNVCSMMSSLNSLNA
jgi:hypothetical protein